MFIFSKFFSLIFLGKIWSQNLKFSDWLKFGTEVDYHMLISILMFMFSKFFSLIFLEQIWSQNVKLFRLTEIWYIGRFYYLFFQIFCHSYSFRQIWSQNLKFFKLTEMWYFDVYFFKILIIHIFGLIWSHKLKFSILTEIWCSVALLYA